MTRIELKNISKNFGATPVVKGLDLTIEAGEFFTFVGPSGCGKSTILNLIAGLEPLSGGEILFNGAPVSGRSPKDRDVAMIFQSYALYPHMTVFENIAFPLKMRNERQERIKNEVQQVAEKLGLEALLARKPRELSGGQRQRVALGRAIVRRPKVFLMDEPLSNLDARLRIETRAELKKLHRELGITTIYVTHDQAEAMGLSDRIAVLDKGAVQQCAEPREVYRRPENVFVAGFIGSPPMNLVRCRVTGTAPLELACNGLAFKPTVHAAPSGNEVIVGIRPEDVVRNPANGAPRATALVVMTEPVGAELWIDAQWGDTLIKALAGPDEPIAVGSEMTFSLPPERLSVFDGVTGKRLE